MKKKLSVLLIFLIILSSAVFAYPYVSVTGNPNTLYTVLDATTVCYLNKDNIFTGSNTFLGIVNLGNATANLTSHQVNGDLNVTGNVKILGNVSIKRPYGMFSSTQTQIVGATGRGFNMSFNWTEDSYQVVKTNNVNFSVQQTGDYLIELSIMGISSSPNQHLEIWVKKNGVDVPRSNTKYEFKAAGAEAVIAVPFILDLNTTDVFTVYYAGDSTSISLPYTTNTTYSPEVPSTIMTITKISEITP